MSMDDDDLERRLRSALTTPRASDRPDTDEFLSGVHRGARVRRTKRAASMAAAAVLVVAGGGLAVNATGLLSPARTPVAGGPTGTVSTTGIDRSPTASPNTPTTKSTPTRPTQSKAGTTITPLLKGPVRIHAHGPIAAGDVTPISLTATGTEHQWVLATTPGGQGCQTKKCASVFVTSDHGGTWRDVGQLPAPPAGPDALRYPRSVSELRFAKRPDGTYDGWAYGNALWSTHDSGTTWSAVRSPDGQVTSLEASGGYVYAAVSTGTPLARSAALYRSPTSTDQWSPVLTGLTHVESLAAANGIIGVIDAGAGSPRLFTSTDGLTWHLQQAACPAGRRPAALSSAGNTTTGIGSLWLTCVRGNTAVVRYLDTDNPAVWVRARGTFTDPVSVAARTPLDALVTGAGAGSTQDVTGTHAPASWSSESPSSVEFFGFTNDHYGYLMANDGSILGTTDGGHTWSPYQVSDTP
ncbi:MAG: hypothetical protein QOI51_80 [Nocardioidaceae bacterium]|jgi:photosystem II stability/assembly factor-like uncharacterized protein|nr:hypothetical protein [Nocardioidaceae bacterium]